MGLKDFFDTVSSPVDSMKQKYVGSFLRWGLGGLGFVIAGKAGDDQIDKLAGLLITLVPLLWSMYEKRQTRDGLVTALGMANTTENHVKALVANPLIQTPDVATHPDVIPTPTVLKVP